VELEKCVEEDNIDPMCFLFMPCLLWLWSMEILNEQSTIYIPKNVHWVVKINEKYHFNENPFQEYSHTKEEYFNVLEV